MQLMSLDLTETKLHLWMTTPLRFGGVLLVTAAFSGLGHAIRGVTRSGAIVGAIICFVLFATAGPGGFVALLTLFIVTWVATRSGRLRKQRLGTAEGREGRTGSQVLANLGVAAICALAYAFRGAHTWLLGMTAALAEAASDTVSSEAGQALSEQSRLITTFETVSAGSDGGITLAGTIAGIGAALVSSAVCVWTDLLPLPWLWIAAAAGTLGMLADSFMGALLERRGWLTNDAVNFAGTLIAAALAAAFLALFP
jgi:uncharacterized protein (TIGR00297 family)